MTSNVKFKHRVEAVKEEGHKNLGETGHMPAKNTKKQKEKLFQIDRWL